MIVIVLFFKKNCAFAKAVLDTLEVAKSI